MSNYPDPRSAVSDMVPYEPGKPIDEIAREYDLDEQPVKLASNENPYSPPEALRGVYEAEFDRLNRYPDGGAYHLRQALSDRYDWPRSGIVIGAGSDEVTDFLARAFLSPGDEAVLADPSFVRHSMLPRMMGAEPVPVPVDDEYKLDLEAMLEAVGPDTKWVFLPNPNNPTSRYVKESRVRSFLSELPGDLTVILDEAYSEFMTEEDYPDGCELLSDFSGEEDPTLILQRTFSKAYGLAGLRVGYALMPPKIARELHKVRPPFNVTRPAQAVAERALDCGDYIEESREKIRSQRDRLLEGLDARGLGYVPPSANFLLLRVPEGTSAAEFCEAMMSRGVIVRSMAPYDLDRHVRLSVGRPEENDRFLDALDDFLE